MGEYRSLYRKYRPQAPDEVLGQEHVVRGLAGAVREGRLAHAFLFSGPRGTGKTSTARILAKMVNCETGPTETPCGTCEQCVRIREGTHLDVVEIDAASHGGVDDARELRERAPTAPAQGREKVYIIDEAQRLSREAFDALLKVFEEPPPGVRFVLATTEPHKMPPTIVGRTQRFEFRRVGTEHVTEHLLRVAKEEDVVLEEAAARLIARQSEGSVRDALSLLDQASVLGGGSVGEEVVGALVGTPDQDVHFELADAIAVGDARGVFELLHRLVDAGHDLRHFATGVATHFRNLLLASASPDDTEIIDVPAEVHARLVSQAQKFSAGELDRVLSLLLQAQTDMRWTTSPRLTLELALVRGARPETDPRPEGLVSRLERLERLAGIGDGAAAAPAVAPDAGAPAPAPSAGPAPEAPDAAAPSRDAPEEAHAPPAHLPEDAHAPPADGPAGSERAPAAPATGGPAPGPSTGSVDTAMLRRSWPQVVETLKERRKMVLFANAEIATVGSYDGETLELVFPPDRPFGAEKVAEKQDELREVLGDMFGISPTVRCTVREGTVLEELSDEPPASPEAAEELLKRQFGAEEDPEPQDGD